MVFQKGHIPWHKGTKGKKPSTSSSFKKGMTPWNKDTKGIMKPNKTSFQPGHEPWNKGMKGCYTEEQLKRYRESHFGNVPSEETKKKMGKSHAGDKNYNWKGGRYLRTGGYVMINMGQGKVMMEHRHIAQKVLGRKLKRNESVHHINGDKTDNRNCNLLICSNSYHRWLENKMAHLYKKEHFGDI